ncbi:hypothetical protein [Anthocerotibacter panamensis]|uniref:hypothetical protein n=1 Tax=Anthocerotibacter panamensis TaxID=2857077 RepID=UPI001C408B09|nr:hypothetical protein [Anthocerotibacter panamensis]
MLMSTCALTPWQDWFIGCVRLGLTYEITTYSPSGSTRFQTLVTQEHLPQAILLAKLYINARVREGRYG